MRRVTPFAVLVLSLLGSVAQSQQAFRYAPEATTVAVVPIVNQSGERDAGFKAKQVDSGNKELNKEFREHGFKLIDAATVEKAISGLKIDLGDEENYNKATLYKIGKTLNADIVVFAVITAVEQHTENKVFVVTMEGRATIKMWLLDARKGTAILSAVTRQGKSGGTGIGFKKGSSEIIHAVANGERDILKDFFRPYSTNRGENGKKAIRRERHAEIGQAPSS